MIEDAHSAEGTPAPRRPPDLPGSRLGAVADTLGRGLFFYPGVAAAGAVVAGLSEGARGPGYGVLALVAGLSLWLATRRDGPAVGDGAADSGGAPGESDPIGWLFSGFFELVHGVLSQLAEGFAGGVLAAVASLGIAAGLTLVTVALAILLAPIGFFLAAPSWARFWFVAVPPFPLTGLFMVVRWVRLRRRMREYERLATASEAAGCLPGGESE